MTKTGSPKINPDQSFTLNFTIPSEEISKNYNLQLQKIRANFSFQGFRPGKVPLKIVTDNIDNDKVIEEIANILISKKYDQLLKDHQLKPIIPPKVKIVNPPLTLNKDWQIEAISCQLPTIDIKPEYKDRIKSLKTKDINQILEIVVSQSVANLPPILIETELNYRLSHLISHLQAAKLSLDQYLKQRKLTPKKLQDNLLGEIVREWTVSLALDKIAKDNQIETKKVLDFLKNL